MRIKGDDGDGSTSVRDYVEQLRADLIQQAVDEAKQLVTVPIQTIVAQKQQGWEASSCGHCSLLETSNCKTRRRRNSQFRPQTQHHREVDWRSALTVVQRHRLRVIGFVVA